MKKRVSTIQELYKFLQEHMVMRGEFDKKFKEMDLRFDKRFKEMDLQFDKKFKEIDIRFDKRFKEIDKRIDKLTTQIDRFIVLHEKLEVEIIALRSQYNRLEERIIKLEARLT